MGHPSFVCIGAQKAGTTWLHAMLAQHPDVYLGPFKEAQFFNHKYLPDDRKWTKWHVKMAVKKQIQAHFKKKKVPDHTTLKRLTCLMEPKSMLTDSWYHSLYDSPDAKGKTLGDITPSYCSLPPEGIEDLKEHCNTPKVIFIIRDPYERAASQLRMAVSRHHKGFKLKRDWESIIGRIPVESRGDYRTFVTRWDEAFSEDDILYIPYGDLRSRPKDMMAQVEKHIGVRPHDYSGLSSKVHKTKHFRIPKRARKLLEERVDGQKDFLMSRFGRDFVSRT